jgi:hypothetical protein
MCRTSEVRHEIEALSAKLRSSDPFFTRLRQCIQDHGVDTDSAILVDLYSEDSHIESGILAGRDGRVFEFEFEYSDGNALNGKIIEWKDISRIWGNSDHYADIVVAWNILGLS